MSNWRGRHKAHFGNSVEWSLFPGGHCDVGGWHSDVQPPCTASNCLWYLGGVQETTKLHFSEKHIQALNFPDIKLVKVWQKSKCQFAAHCCLCLRLAVSEGFRCYECKKYKLFGVAGGTSCFFLSFCPGIVLCELCVGNKGSTRCSDGNWSGRSMFLLETTSLPNAGSLFCGQRIAFLGKTQVDSFRFRWRRRVLWKSDWWNSNFSSHWLQNLRGNLHVLDSFFSKIFSKILKQLRL